MSDFEKLNGDESLPLWKEFLLFVKENKAWWLVPILVVLGLVSLLVVLTASGAAPFIYTVF